MCFHAIDPGSSQTFAKLFFLVSHHKGLYFLEMNKADLEMFCVKKTVSGLVSGVLQTRQALQETAQSWSSGESPVQ